jgi:hypothetical protein
MPSSATSAIRFLLASVAMASLAGAFVSPPHHSRAMQQQQHQHHHQHHHRQQLQAAKGFGGETKAAKAAAAAAAAKAAKPKSAAALKRDEAAETLEKEGTPEYAVFARDFGGTDKDWKPVGSIACPRTDRPDDMIFTNEDALVSGLFKLYPAMKKEGENFEYGYRLKKFPDDEIRLAFKRTGKSENPIMNWIGSLSNPVNTDNY